MKSESKTLFVTASGIFVKTRKRRVAKKDRLTSARIFCRLQVEISL